MADLSTSMREMEVGGGGAEWGVTAIELVMEHEGPVFVFAFLPQKKS